MTTDQLFVKRIYWPKVLMFLIAVVAPQVAIGISNLEVFPHAIMISCIIIGMIIAAGALSTYFSGNAAPKTRRLAIIHDSLIGCASIVVLLMHFQIAREVSAATDAVKANLEVNRIEQENKDRETSRQISLAAAKAEELKAEALKTKEETRKLIQLPPSQRRALIPVTKPTRETLTSFSSAVASNETSEAKKVQTPQEIRESWFKPLFIASAVELIIAILGGLALIGHWQWDVDGDGKPDTPYTSHRQAAGFAQGVPIAAKADAKPSGGNIYYPTDLGK